MVATCINLDPMKFLILKTFENVNNWEYAVGKKKQTSDCFHSDSLIGKSILQKSLRIEQKLVLSCRKTSFLHFWFLGVTLRLILRRPRFKTFKNDYWKSVFLLLIFKGIVCHERKVYLEKTLGHSEVFFKSSLSKNMLHT